MDQGLRSSKALLAKIDKHWDELVKHYEAIVSLIGTKDPSRNTTSIMQYQIQVHTAAIIRAGEEFQLLIRQMQEMWLFGRLDTLGESEVQQQTDENAKIVGQLLRQVLAMQQSVVGASGDEAVATGTP